MTTIGFANKFYTLWEVKSEPRFSTIHTANGEQHYQSGTKYICQYIKNVSFDLDKVKTLYPNAPIDDTLRGKSNSFDWTDGYQKIEYADDVFSIGYNRGSAITECTSFRDLKWAYENESGTSRKINIEKAMNEIGAYIYNGNVYETKELMDVEVDRISKQKANSLRIANIYESMTNGGSITVQIERNLSAFGTIEIDGILYKFNNFKPAYYNGYNYSLPSIKGKGKRVKGKFLELVVKTSIFIHPEIRNEGDICLTVESFKILK